MDCACSIPKHPKAITGTVLRITFGFSLLLIGVSHYQGIGDFAEMTASGLGPLSFLGAVWAYILPLLMIVGGALFVLKKKPEISTWCITIALGSIAIGMLLKPVLSNDPSTLGQAMSMSQSAFLWFVFFVVAKWADGE